MGSPVYYIGADYWYMGYVSGGGVRGLKICGRGGTGIYMGFDIFRVCKICYLCIVSSWTRELRYVLKYVVSGKQSWCPFAVR
jgi:hypothetical protein